MANITDILGRPFVPPSDPIIDPPEIQLKDAIRQAGMLPPERVVIDGHLHRFAPTGQPKDDAGWYVAFPGVVAAGQFGDWRTGSSISWRSEIGRDLTVPEQMAMSRQAAEARRLRDAEQAARRDAAATTADAIWAAATTASDDHPYIVAKGISAMGLRVTGDGRLVAPLYADGRLVSVQFIAADGDKRYLTGGKAGGACWLYSPDSGSGTVYVCEGVATAASIFEATGQAVVVAYSAGNLTAAAHHARSIAGMREVVIVADNDASGTGQREADKAAQATGARVIMPPSGDANDYAQAGGDLHSLLCPPPAVSGFLIPADEFAGEPSPIRWIIKRWIQRDSLHMIHGPSGGGKTFLVLDMILHAAAGLSEWFGQRVTQVPVVYLAGEGHAGLKARIAGWKIAHEVSHLEAWVSRAGDDLNTPGGLARVQEAIRALPVKPAIIVVDTLHRFLAGDENSAQDAKTMLDACAIIQREFLASIILVHHTGVSEEAQHRARGSSAWRGALDIEISVIPATADRPIEIVQRKSKDAELAASQHATLSTITLPWIDEDGDPVTTAYLTEADAPAKKEKAAKASIRRIESVFVMLGEIIEDGSVYLSAQNMRDGYVQAYPKGEPGSAERMLRRDKTEAVSAGKITEAAAGYVIACPDMSMAVAISINENKNKHLR